MLKFNLRIFIALACLYLSAFSSVLYAQGKVSFAQQEIVVDEAVGTVSFTINLVDSSKTDSVLLRFKNLGTGAGLAQRPADFVFADTMLYFINKKNTQNTLSLSIVDDLLAEGEEAFILELVNPSSGIVLGVNNSLKIRIIDNEKPKLAFSLASQVFSENAGTVKVVINVSDPNAQSVKADVILKGGSATNGTDFTYSTTNVFIPAGSTQPYELEVTLFDDAIIEPTENLYLQLVNLVNADTLVGFGSTEVRIDDNDYATVNFVKTASKTTEGSPQINVALVLDSVNFEKTATVNFIVIDNTAINPADYTAPASTSVSFAPGTKGPILISIPIVDDAIIEDVENFSIRLISASNANLGAKTVHVVSIIDNDQALISLQQNLPDVPEGSGSNTLVNITATLNTVAASDVTADVVVIGGTASFGADFDYSPKSILIPAASLSTSFNLSIVGDLLSENDETIVFALQNLSNNAKSDATSITSQTVIDDDGPRFAFLRTKQSTLENSGTDSIGVVALNAHPSKSFSVEVLGTDLTTNSPADYTLAVNPTVLNFVGGGPDTLYVPISITDDAIIEANESLVFTLQNASAGATLALTNQNDTLTILDDDASLMEFVSANYMVAEGAGMVQVDVQLSQANPFDTLRAQVALAAGGSATQGLDFTYATNQVLTFPPNTVGPISISIPIIQDGINEGDEQFNLFLSPSNAKTIIGTIGITNVLIQDDDIPRPIFKFELDTQAVVEGTDSVFIKILINESSTVPVTVDLALQAGGTATEGLDFRHPAPLTISFSPGVLAKRVGIAIIDDALTERNEDFILLLTNATNSSVVGPDSIHRVYIIDNELSEVNFDEDTIYVLESAIADTMIIRMNGFDSCNVKVDLIQGTATQVLDYLAFNTSQVSLSETTDSVVVPLPIIPDVFQEADEFYQFRLSTPATNGCRVGKRDTITIIIVDDDRGGAVNFEFENITTSEDNEILTLNVTSDSLGLFKCNLSVEVLSSSTATPVKDILFNGVTIEYTLLGNATKTYDLPIVDDELVEGDEFLVLRLKPAADLSKSCKIGFRDTLTILIRDNDFAQPIYKIAQIKGVDANGKIDSLGIKCELRGITHGLNYAGFSTTDLNFFMQDGTGGINVRYSPGNLGYTFAEGDSLHIIGVLRQVKGLAYIEPIFLTKQAQSRKLYAPIQSTVLNEANESQLIELTCLKLNAPEQWTNKGSFFEAQGSNSVGTYRIRIPDFSSLYGSPAPTKFFNIKGIVSQEDVFGGLANSYFVWARNYQDLTTSVKANFTQSVSGTTVQFTNATAFGTSFYWDFGDGKGYSIAKDPKYTYARPGVYVVTLSATRETGCFDVTSKEVRVADGTTGIERYSSALIESIYPNPSKDYLTIKTTANLKALVIRNVAGQVVFTEQSVLRELNINISHLAKGMYLLELNTEDGIVTTRISKE